MSPTTAALPTGADGVKYDNGNKKWRESGYRLVYGDYGFGYQGLPLPFGEDAEIDYFLTSNGHGAN